MNRFNNILVVCIGNICRSPVAAALLKKHFPERAIYSAGLAAQDDAEANATAAELVSSEGIDLSDHRAQRLTNVLIAEADLILVMTQGQRQAIVEQKPEASGKVMLFGQWLPASNVGQTGREIPDPHGKSREVFEQVHNLLCQAADSWKKRL